MERVLKFASGMLFIAGLVAFSGADASVDNAIFGIVCMSVGALLATVFEWERI